MPEREDEPQLVARPGAGFMLTMGIRGRIDVVPVKSPKQETSSDQARSSTQATSSARATSSAQEVSPDQDADDLLATLVDELNKEADTLAHKLEKEIGRFLPVGITVSAELDFGLGSFDVAALVTFVQWAGPLVAEATIKALGERVVPLLIERVVDRWLQARPRVGTFPGPIVKRRATFVVEFVDTGRPADRTAEVPRSMESWSLPRPNYLAIVNSALLLVIAAVEVLRGIHIL